MLDILWFYGIPPETIEAIKVMFSNTRSVVLTPVGETESIDILAGILQVDTLVSFLFSIAIVYISRMSVDTMTTKWIYLSAQNKLPSSCYLCHR